MEVPKQSLADEDDDEKGKPEDDAGFSSSRKRKYPPSSGKKNSKNKKGLDSALLESTARPLAKVGDGLGLFWMRPRASTITELK